MSRLTTTIVCFLFDLGASFFCAAGLKSFAVAFSELAIAVYNDGSSRSSEIGLAP